MVESSVSWSSQNNKYKPGVIHGPETQHGHETQNIQIMTL